MEVVEHRAQDESTELRAAVGVVHNVPRIHMAGTAGKIFMLIFTSKLDMTRIVRPKDWHLQALSVCSGIGRKRSNVEGAKMA